MMIRKIQSPRFTIMSSSVLRCGVVFLIAASVIAQSRIIRPPAQTNTNSKKRTHVATLRSSDSSEGSRVAISSDQSLTNYEAYRRGDRFYVKIPAADVPRAEAVRGRGFADVKAQRSGDSTVVSFRLQPGATAHVEPRGNKLDVVVSVPGGGTPSIASNRTGETSRPNVFEPRRIEPSKRGGSSNANRSESNRSAANRSGANADKNAANSNRNSRTNPATAANNSNSNSKSKPSPTVTPAPKPSPTAGPSPKPTATVKTPTPSPAQKSASPNTTSASTQNSSPVSPAQGDFWARTKERAHYWILLAQLNPIPVAVGAIVLLLIIGLLLFQRRRARATRRVKRSTKKPEASTSSGAKTAAVAAEAAANNNATTNAIADVPVEVAPVVPVVTSSASSDEGRRERVNRVADEAKKVFAGDQYDESTIGSDDHETRRLVGAELASALVGRDAERRNRARAAFMKHGYFDDATRDLRVAESPNERATAARRLSFVSDREATPHLIGALGDPEPDVRRAAVEALMDSRDPAAIAPLNSLLQNETDRKVPHNLIQQAIDACATATPATSTPEPEFSIPSIPQSVPPAVETEREVIEL
jgi:HEAT repeat protein